MRRERDAVILIQLLYRDDTCHIYVYENSAICIVKKVNQRHTSSRGQPTHDLIFYTATCGINREIY